MSRNVGTIDRVFRAVVGIGLGSLVFVGPLTQLSWRGLVALATAASGWCPPYALLGFSTCAAKTPWSGSKA